MSTKSDKIMVLLKFALFFINPSLFCADVIYVEVPFASLRRVCKPPFPSLWGARTREEGAHIERELRVVVRGRRREWHHSVFEKDTEQL